MLQVITKIKMDMSNETDAILTFFKFDNIASVLLRFFLNSIYSAILSRSTIDCFAIAR